MIKVSGTWGAVSSSMDSGGSYGTLNAEGYAELVFDATGITWAARTNTSSGIAEVYVDGVKRATVDLYSSTTRYQQRVFVLEGLSDAPHTVRIVRTGTKNASSVGRNVTLDYLEVLDVTPPSAPTGPSVVAERTGARVRWTLSPDDDVDGYRVYRSVSGGAWTALTSSPLQSSSYYDDGLQPGTAYRYAVTSLDTGGNESARSTAVSLTTTINAVGQGTYEQDNNAVTLNGGWTTSVAGTDSGGSSATLGAAGYAELSFSTSGIRWIARTNNYSGTADVYLDGVKKATVDLYSAESASAQTVYEVSGLTEADHTIRIVRTGDKNAASTGRNITLDAFVAPDVNAPTAPLGLRATLDGPDANLSWTANSEPDIKGYRIYRRVGTSGTRALVGSTTVSNPTYTDSGLEPGITYRYDIVAVDTSDNASPASSAVSVTMPINAVGQGTYEEDSSAVLLSGGWTTSISAADSGGSAATLGATGYAELSFSTSGIRWIARTNNYSGTADVYLDGVKKTTIDLYSADSASAQTVYEVSGLPETNHTIRIVRTGEKNTASTGRNITLDAFVAPDVHAPTAPIGLRASLDGNDAKLSWPANSEADIKGYRIYRRVGTTGTRALVGSTTVSNPTYTDPALDPGTTYRYDVVAVDTSDNTSVASSTVDLSTPIAAHGAGTYENDSPVVTRSGTWTVTASGSDSGGSTSSLNGVGYAELSFRTSGVRWISRTNTYSGIAEVYIDGVRRATVDLYSSTTKTRQVVYEVTGLPETNHTIRIVRTGTKNAASSSTAISLDAFVAPDLYPPSAPATLTATPRGTGARLTWSASPQSDVAGYRVYRAQGSGTLVRVATDPVAGTAYADEGLQPGVAFTYAVTAVDAMGNESPRSGTTSVTTTIDPVGQGTYETDDPAVTLFGSWGTSESAADSGGSIGMLNAAGYAEMSFSTSGVRVLARRNNYSGMVKVYLDGVEQRTVDLYAANASYKQVVYEVAGLAETPHTVRVVRTGTRHASSAGFGITVDAFVAPDVHPPVAPSGLRATVYGTGVDLAWSTSHEPDIRGYNVYRRVGTSGVTALVGETGADTTVLTDPGRDPGTSYRYHVVAVDTTGNLSPLSAGVDVTMPIRTYGAGTYENDSDAVTLDGTWTATASTLDSGGSTSAVNGPGYAELSFTTSGVRWITRKNTYSGIADVYLDGVKKASIDLYSSTTKTQQVVYEVTGLPETTHTLRVVRTGTKNASSTSTAISLDAFVAPDIYPPSAPTAPTAVAEGTGARVGWTAGPELDVLGYRVYRALGSGPLVAVTETVSGPSWLNQGLQPGTAYRFAVTALDAGGNESPPSSPVSVTTAISAMGDGTYENDNSAVTLSGPWSTVSSTGAGTDSGSSYATLNAIGYAEVSFSTSGVRWLARTNNSSGTADVYLDGVKKATVDLYSDTTRYAQNVWEIRDLPETPHTIRIVRTGDKNADSIGRNITLDAFVAPDIYAPAAPDAESVVAIRTGGRVAWAGNDEPDVASYRIFRQQVGGAEQFVGSVPANARTFDDVGLAASTTYRWTVVARDRSGNESPHSAQLTLSTGPDETSAYPRRYATCPAATRTVSTRAELLVALRDSGPGTVVRVNPGSYGGKFDVSTSGTAERPIWVCGSRSAVFDNGDTASGYGFKVQNAAHVVLAGMTVRNAQKGITVMSSSQITVADLRVEDIGNEAIHLKNQTSDSAVIGNSITRTGRTDPQYGEGVYIGTAQGNWCAYNGCLPDRSNTNLIALNNISATTAEPIEAKAGTEGGTITWNVLDGRSVVADDADSLVQMLGSGWVLSKNTGSYARLDAIQVWTSTEPGWGAQNVVYANSLGTSVPGYAVRLPFADVANVVGCDNLHDSSGWGLSNKSCQQ